MLSCRCNHHAVDKRQQSGFTLVELAMSLALLGVLAVIGFKSIDLVEQYRQTQFVNSIRTLQSQLTRFQATHGRWPGDCDRDGLMDPALDSSTNIANAGLFDYSVSLSLTPATSGSDAYSSGMICPTSTLARLAHVNVPYNELKWGGLFPSGEPNKIAASHALGGFAFVGTFSIVPNATNIEDKFNAIVLSHVPVSAARRLAVAVDGSDGSAANVNRVRRTNDMSTFAPLWSAAGETQDKIITVVYFFDRQPPSNP